MSEARQARISSLRASLRECNRGMDEFPASSMDELQRLQCEEYYGMPEALESTKIRTPVGDLMMRADPTLKPTEMRIMHSREHDDDEWVDDPSDLRPDGFTQSNVDAAKAVLLSKVERKQ